MNDRDSIDKAIEKSEEVVEMDAVIKKPSLVLDSIDDSFKQIKDYKEGKVKFLSLKGSKENWKKWVKETKDEL